MNRENINGRRLVGLFLLGMLLFNFPLIYLFNRPVVVLGVPVFYLYLFATWALIISLTLIISRTKTGTQLPDHRW
jgi:hypothetical protein